jgi:glycosyltransferase involved in cell wall biosynthesis
LKILILSKDPSFFESESNTVIGDSLSRHIYYAEQLRSQYPKSLIKIITYTKSHNYINNSRLIYPSIEIVGTNSKFRVLFVFGMLFKIFELFKGGWRPDIITVQTPWEEGVVGLIVARLFGIAFLPQLHFDLFSDQWKNESLLNPYLKFIAKFILRRGDRIRVVSRSLQKQVSRILNIKIDQIDVIPVGVNFIPSGLNKHSARNKIWPKYNDRKIILFVGRLCKAKNLKLWLKVAKKSCEKNKSLIFMIVGDGEESTHLITLAKKLNLYEKVIFCGAKKHKELPIIYKASDLFLLTSSNEGFGRVVLEAQMSGIPVISTKSGGPQDLIIHAETGFLTELDDLNEITNSINTLLENDELYRHIAQQAKASSDKFSLHSLSINLINCWKKTIN